MSIQAMMKQAKKMQEELEKAQKEIFQKEFKVEKQGVTVVMTGDGRLQSLTIDEILIDPDDKDIIEDLIVIAVNEVKEIIDEELEAIQPKAPGGMPF